MRKNVLTNLRYSFPHIEIPPTNSTLKLARGTKSKLVLQEEAWHHLQSLEVEGFHYINITIAIP